MYTVLLLFRSDIVTIFIAYLSSIRYVYNIYQIYNLALHDKQ